MRPTLILGLLSSAFFVPAESSSRNATEVSELLQELQQLPECATTCVATALPASKCDPTDFDCLCSDEPYIANSELCILSTCTIKGSLSAQAWQKKACHAPVRDTGPLTRRIGTALLVIGAICIACRFVARWRIQSSSIGWDDWAILVSYLLLIPSTAIVQIMTYKGMGQDIWRVPFDNITMMLKYFYVEQYIYQVVIVLTKISIVLLYLRIFPKEVSSRFHQTCWVVIGALTVYCIGFLVYFACECRPISLFWTQWDGEHEGYCLDTQAAIYANSAFNIFFDLVVFFLPVPKLLKLQVRDTKRKISAVFTFLLGLFVTICSVVRLKYLSNLGKITNATYHYNDISLWSGLEGDVGVICACMPTIAGPVLYFFRETVGSKLSSMGSSRTGQTGTSTSRMKPDKSTERLPSNASVQEAGIYSSAHKAGGIERTVETSLYNTPRGYASGDDVELIGRDPKRGSRSQWGV